MLEPFARGVLMALFVLVMSVRDCVSLAARALRCRSVRAQLCGKQQRSRASSAQLPAV
jgi:hypothetical protein